MHRVTLIPGDGIGAEVVPATARRIVTVLLTTPPDTVGSAVTSMNSLEGRENTSPAMMLEASANASDVPTVSASPAAASDRCRGRNWCPII